MSLSEISIGEQKTYNFPDDYALIDSWSETSRPKCAIMLVCLEHFADFSIYIYIDKSEFVKGV